MTGNLPLGDNYITGLNSKQTDYDTNQPNLRQEIIHWKNSKWEDRTDNGQHMMAMPHHFIS